MAPVFKTPPALAHLGEALDELERASLRRRRATPYSGSRPSFCSNDYLGLASTTEGFSGASGGASASRLVVGESDAHGALEHAIARWLGTEDALVFTSGYAANVALLQALAAPRDLVVSDALNHASLVDGCRLSRARVAVVPHLDVEAVRRALREPGRTGRAWVVTESYFSMDADSPDLRALRSVCDENGAALLVDEAHALGVLGPDGRGLSTEAGIAPDAVVGTLGKAFGRQGAFIAGSRVLTDWLWNRARSFVFSTGLSPALAASAQWALEHAAAHPELRETCLANATVLRDGLSGFRLLGFGPIIPVRLPSIEATLGAADAIRGAGVHVQAIRPPTVPEGTARLRLTVTARHSRQDIEHALNVLTETLSRFT